MRRVWLPARWGGAAGSRHVTISSYDDHGQRRPAAAAFKRFPHRAITVATWVEIMAETPDGLAVQTREFLRTFERLAISEGISDRALALVQKHPGLELRHAIAWATALANELIYITRDLPEDWADKGLWIPYRK